MFKHLKFNSLGSTQDELKSFVTQNDLAGIPLFKGTSIPKILCSTLEQTQGFGRQGKAWVKTTSSLAFSFTLPQLTPPTLTSLFIPVMISEFFSSYQIEVKVKWPNDLLNQKNQKCGGIILQSKKDFFIVGVGINLKKAPNISRIQFPSGSLISEDQDHPLLSSTSYAHDLPASIYEFILNRFTSVQAEDIRRSWQEKCAHLNVSVEIKDQDKIEKGIFIGIDNFGQAILKTETNESSKEIVVSNGSLLITEKKDLGI